PEREEATRSLELSSDHLLIIEGVLTPTRRVLPDWKPDDSSGGGGSSSPTTNPLMLPDDALCLKVGAAFIEANKTGSNVHVTLTESELWILRERVDSQARIGNSPVGMEIKTQVYDALLSITNSRAANDMMEETGMTDGDVEEPDADAGREAMDAVTNPWGEEGRQEEDEQDADQQGDLRERDQQYWEGEHNADTSEDADTGKKSRKKP
ncbi:MAG: hypothetical protein Q7R39_02225, partial [Dehalococcoidia bacterium]|nr:hypothetical protein [Dehalococcoidia bacterium]